MAKIAKWTDDWTVGVRVWVARDGTSLLGEGRADLLAAIDRLHSITKAAKAVGMSYRRAWSLIQDANEAAGVPLVQAAVGGAAGGGARLTQQGRLALGVYEQLRTAVYSTASGMLQRIIHPSERGADCLHVAAAISLQEAVGQLLAEYALQRPVVRVRAIYGASNELADHLLAGAPADIFISADAAPLNRLFAAGLIATNSRRVVAHNSLTVIGSDKHKPMKKPADLLDAKIKHVAIAEPECPLGKYSHAYLQTSKIYDKIRPKLLEVDNSRAVLAAVESAAADVGLAFASDAARSDRLKTLLRVPTAESGAQYEAAIIQRPAAKTKGKQKGPSSQRCQARQLLEFLTSRTAARCFHRCGFRPFEKQ